jgi:hypothetical protein
MSLDASSPSGRPDAQIRDARQADYVAFLFRLPYALDAHQLGFATGLREDYDYQNTFQNVDVPVFMLDNDFKDPDLERYKVAAKKHTPRVGVVGDAYDEADAHEQVAAARHLEAELEPFDPVIVPKCKAALEAIPDDIVVGYPIGYSDIHAPDFSAPQDWAGRRVHILGGSPPKQWDAIRQLVPGGTADRGQAQLGAFNQDVREGADIVGMDWNGLHNIAMKGEYWHHESPHWRPADDLTIRETVRRGLRHIKIFWKLRGVWPTLTPADVEDAYEEAVEPDHELCSGCGTDLSGPDDWVAVVEHEDGAKRAFCSDACHERFKYHAGPVPINRSATGDWLHTQDRVRMDGFNAQ